MRLVLLAVAFSLAAGLTTVSADPTCAILDDDGDGVIEGTGGPDFICGGEGNDTIHGHGGADVIHGFGGDDTIYGEAGDDEIHGGAGNDVLLGGAGVNTLEGGDGEDHLRSDPGAIMDGGPGSDVCIPGGESCGSPSPTDPDDAPGFLDVSRVDTRLSSSAEFRVYVRSRVKRRRMWDSGYVLVHLDTRGSPDYDYYAMVRAVRRGFRASLWIGSHRIARLPLWRTSRSNFSFRVPLSYMSRGSDRSYYRWRVQTMTDRCRGWCWDHVTNEGALTQPYPDILV